MKKQVLFYSQFKEKFGKRISNMELRIFGSEIRDDYYVAFIEKDGELLKYGNGSTASIALKKLRTTVSHISYHNRAREHQQEVNNLSMSKEQILKNLLSKK